MPLALLIGSGTLLRESININFPIPILR